MARITQWVATVLILCVGQISNAQDSQPTGQLNALLPKAGYEKIQAQSNHQLGGMTTGKTANRMLPFNLGPTGILATRDAEKLTYKVREILPGSPAVGKVRIDDVIVGIGQKRFSQLPGPPESKPRYPNPQMGMAIEAAEASADATLQLMLQRGTATKTVTLQLQPLGEFGSNFPAKSNKAAFLATLNARMLASRQLDSGLWGRGFKGERAKGKLLPTCMSALALMSTDDKRFKPNIKRAFEAVLKMKPNSFQSWQFCYKSIFLAEYHLRYKDRRAIKPIEDMVQQLAGGAFYYNGVYGYGHGLNRGNYRYGGINACTAHAALTFGIARRLGIEVPAEMDLKMAKSIERLAPNGALDYAWQGRSIEGGIKSVKHNEDQGRTGVALIAYRLLGGREQQLERMKDYLLLNKEYADCGHSCGGSMSWVWGAIAMSYDSPDNFRKLMQSRIWYWDFNRMPQGDFYLQPSAHGQFRSSDVVLGPNFTTAGNVIILNASKQNLLITGNEEWKPKTDTAYKTDVVAASSYFERQDRLVEISEAGSLLKNNTPKSVVQLLKELRKIQLDDPRYPAKSKSLYRKYLKKSVKEIAGDKSLTDTTRNQAIAALVGINYSPTIKPAGKSLRIQHSVTPPNLGTLTIKCEIGKSRFSQKVTSSEDRSTQRLRQKLSGGPSKGASATTVIHWEGIPIKYKFPLEVSAELRGNWSPSQTDTIYGPFKASVEKAESNGSFQARLPANVLFEGSLMGNVVISQNGRASEYKDWVKKSKSQLAVGTIVEFTYFNRAGKILTPMVDTIKILE